MNKIVCLSGFPAQRYELLQSLPSQEDLDIIRCKNKAQKISYLLLSYKLKQLPDRIQQKIVEEIEQLGTYDENFILIANKAFVCKEEDIVNVSLRVRSYKSKTLLQIINTSKYTSIMQEKTAHMIRLAEIIKMMHVNRHPHGRIALSNIIYKKATGEFLLETPEYVQIQKWKLRNRAKQQKIKQKSWNRPNLPNDILCLGTVYLQMWLNLQLPKDCSLKDAQLLLPKIEHQGIRYIIQRMLAAPREGFRIEDVIQHLKNLQSLKIPAKTPANSQLYDHFVFDFQLFPQSQPITAQLQIVIKVQIKKATNFGQLTFTMVGGRIYVGLTSKGRKNLVFADCSYQISKHRQRHKWITLQIIKEILDSPETIFRLNNNGVLQVECQIPKIKKSKIKPQFAIQRSLAVRPPSQSFSLIQFDKVCRIQGQKVRSGIIISQNFVLTSAWQLRDLKIHEDHLYFQSSLYKKVSDKNCDLWVASEEAEMYLQKTYNFCLLNFNLNIKLAHFRHYLKLIKSYSEEIIDSKIRSQVKRKYNYSYRLGNRQFSKGKIGFEDSFFYLRSQDYNQILSGEPLLLSISSGVFAIIGLYEANGHGILFNDEFYWTLFKMIFACRGQREMKESNLSFIFIQCMQLDINEGEIPNLNGKSLNFFMRSNNLSRNDIISTLSELQKEQPKNERSIGFFNFILFKEVQQVDFEMSLFHLQQAEKYFSSYYQGKDNFICALIHYYLGNYLLNCEIDPTQIMYHLKISQQMLSRAKYNPIILFKFIQACIMIPGLEQQERKHLYLQKQNLCKNLGLIKFLIIDYREQINQIKKQFHGNQRRLRLQFIQTELKKFETYRFSIKKFDFQVAIKRTKRSIAACDLYLILQRLDELLARQQYLQPNEEMQKRIKQLWKSALVVFTEKCGSLDQLQDFQNLTKTYYKDDGYQQVKGNFIQKRQAIIASQTLPNYQ